MRSVHFPLRERPHLPLKMMKEITLINPNSTLAMNSVILGSAERAAGCSVALRVVYVEESPSLINTDADEIRAAYWTLSKVKMLQNSTDGFVIACHSDPAVSAVEEETGKKTVGIGFASLSAAARYAGKSAILAISEHSIRRKTALARRYGFEGRFDTYASGYSEMMSESEILQCLESAARIALQKADYASLVLGCAGMGCAAPMLRKRLPIPVIDGVEEAVKFFNR